MISCLHAHTIDRRLARVTNKLSLYYASLNKQPIREATVLHGGNGNFAIRQGDWVLIDGKR